MEEISLNEWYSEGKLAEILECTSKEIINIYDIEPYLFTPGETTNILELGDNDIRFFKGEGIVWIIFRSKTKKASALSFEIIRRFTRAEGDNYGQICP